MKSLYSKKQLSEMTDKEIRELNKMANMEMKDWEKFSCLLADEIIKRKFE